MTDFAGGSDTAAAIALQGNGKILVAGETNSPSAGDFGFALARYNPDGTLDRSFGAGGKVTTGFAGSAYFATALALQGNGKIVTAGYAFLGGRGPDFALARYHPDGTLDRSFGTGGTVTTDFAGDYDQAAALTLQGNGKIVAAGYARTGGRHPFAFALARYNPDGTLDRSFGTGGKVTTDFAGSDYIGAALALQWDGRIVVAGSASTGGNDFALARYDPDGSLDPSFGTRGRVTTDFDGSGDSAFALALQGNGKIVAAGWATSPNGTDFALARYNSDGTLNRSFGSGGKVTTDFDGGEDSARALVLQGNGKIVAAGIAYPLVLGPECGT